MPQTDSILSFSKLVRVMEIRPFRCRSVVIELYHSGVTHTVSAAACWTLRLGINFRCAGNIKDVNRRSVRTVGDNRPHGTSAFG